MGRENVGEEEEHDIFVGVGFVQIDFTGQGSLWENKKGKMNAATRNRTWVFEATTQRLNH